MNNKKTKFVKKTETETNLIIVEQHCAAKLTTRTTATTIKTIKEKIFIDKD